MRHRRSPKRRKPSNHAVARVAKPVTGRTTEADGCGSIEAVVSSAADDLARRAFQRGEGNPRVLEPLFELPLLQRIYVRIARWMDITGAGGIVQVDATRIPDLVPALLGDVRATADLKQTMYHWRLALREPVHAVGITADGGCSVTFHYADANGCARFWMNVTDDQGRAVVATNVHATPIVSLTTVLEQTQGPPPYDAWADRMLADAVAGNEHARAAVSRIKRATIALIMVLTSFSISLAVSPELRAAVRKGLIKIYERITGSSVIAPPETLRSMDVSISGACVDGRPNIALTWNARPPLTPPFALIRNGNVVRRDLNTARGVVVDTNVAPGQAYSYLIGKQQGDKFITGPPMTTHAPTCPARPTDARTIGSFPLLAATPEEGTAPLTVTFTAAAPVQGDGAYVWEFDDGTRRTTSRPSVTHTFRYAGAHNVTSRSATGDYIAKVRILVSGDAAPRAPLELQRMWRGNIASTSGFIGTNETEFIFRAKPIPHVVAYRWAFGDCEKPTGSTAVPAVPTDCFTPSTSNPEIRYRFARGGGSETVRVMLIYDSGQVMVHNVGAVWITAPDDPRVSGRTSPR